MKKILLILSLSLSLFAGDIKWHSYKEMLSLKSDKPVFVFVSSTHCGFCKKELYSMEKDKSFVEFINKKFIPVYISQDVDYTPVHLMSRVTPSFYVTDKEGKYIVEPMYGLQEPYNLMRTLNRAEYIYRSQK